MIVSMADQPATGLRLPARIDEARQAFDDASWRRHAAAISAALLVHALVFSLLLVKPPEKIPVVEPPIPIEIVSEVTPKPKLEAKPKAEEKPLPPPPPEAAPPPEPQKIRESGGTPDRPQGQPIKAPATRAVAIPEKKLVHASPAKPPPPIDLSLPSLASGLSIPAAPRSPPSRTEQATISLTPPDTPSAESANASPVTGEGGGDRYLNAVRDAIIRHLTYPASARLGHLAGTAQYAIVIDRQGRLLGVHLLQSTGSDILDRAGIETIREAAPFDPPPPDLTGERIGMLLTLNLEPLSF
jgi:protein TonB